MNLLAEDYNGINGQQVRDAEETIAKILEDSNEKFELILDVGCGTGNVTRLLSQKLTHDKILAIDIDLEIIEFSQKTLSAIPNIEFLVQDISIPWEQLNEKLQALEGKVNLVWSNRVLHWILDEDRPRAAKNIIRLLKPGGRLYINTTLMWDLNEYLKEEEREESKKILKVPSFQEQRNDWEGNFSNLGLKDLHVQFFEKDWIYDSPEDFWKLCKVVTIYKRYFSTDVPPEKVEEILAKYYTIFARVVATPFRQPIVEMSENFTHWHYGQFRIIGKK